MSVKAFDLLSLLIKGILTLESGTLIVLFIVFAVYIYVVKEKQIRHYHVIKEFMTAFEARTEPIKMKMKSFYQANVMHLTDKNTVKDCKTLTWPKETMAHITTDFHNRLVDNIFDAGLKTMRRIIQENNIPPIGSPELIEYTTEKYEEYMSIVGKMRLYGYTEVFYPVKSDLILKQAAKVKEEHRADFFSVMKLARKLKDDKKVFKIFKV
jgi:hypothetical protein